MAIRQESAELDYNWCLPGAPDVDVPNAQDAKLRVHLLAGFSPVIPGGNSGPDDREGKEDNPKEAPVSNGHAFSQQMRRHTFGGSFSYRVARKKLATPAQAAYPVLAIGVIKEEAA